MFDFYTSYITVTYFRNVKPQERLALFVTKDIF